MDGDREEVLIEEVDEVADEHKGEHVPNAAVATQNEELNQRKVLVSAACRQYEHHVTMYHFSLTHNSVCRLMFPHSSNNLMGNAQADPLR